MKFVLAVILILAVPLAFGFDCNVTCPKGYAGVCIKDDKGCNCSCAKDSKAVKDYILNDLKAADASPELQKRVGQLLFRAEDWKEQTLTDENTGKKFTIILKKPA